MILTIPLQAHAGLRTHTLPQDTAPSSSVLWQRSARNPADASLGQQRTASQSPVPQQPPRLLAARALFRIKDTPWLLRIQSVVSCSYAASHGMYLNGKTIESRAHHHYNVHDSVCERMARLKLWLMHKAGTCCLAATAVPNHTQLQQNHAVLLCNITSLEESAGC